MADEHQHVPASKMVGKQVTSEHVAIPMLPAEIERVGLILDDLLIRTYGDIPSYRMVQQLSTLLGYSK